VLSLADLRTEEYVALFYSMPISPTLSSNKSRSSDVRDVWNRWVTQLVANYSIDGLRIDSAREVETSFYAGFESAAGVYCMGEVDDGDPAIVTPYQQYLDGVLDYPRCVGPEQTRGYKRLTSICA
jgi:hypothetical protein